MDSIVTMTVDEAAKHLGISHRSVITLISSGRLRWTIGADKHTVLVEVPPDAQPVSPAASSARDEEGETTSQRSGHLRRAISEIDAWSQRR